LGRLQLLLRFAVKVPSIIHLKIHGLQPCSSNASSANEPISFLSLEVGGSALQSDSVRGAAIFRKQAPKTPATSDDVG
jgi:hypothetical protein